MDREERDIWAWSELIVSMLSGVAIPLVLGYFSYQFRADQQKAHNTDRIRNSIELLASDAWRERAMGVRLMWHYCHDTAQYPKPLIASLIRTMRTDPNPNVYREAARLFGTSSTSNTCRVQFNGRSGENASGNVRRGASVDSVSGQHRPRAQLYLHVQSRSQSTVADRITRTIDSMSLRRLRMDIIRIEEPQRVGPSRSELRYFDPRQRDVAQSIADRINQAGLADLDVRDKSRRYDTIPNHFELWLAP